MADFTLNVKGDYDAILRDLDEVERRLAPAAAAAALNIAVRRVRTASRREIAAVKRITPQKLVGERLKLVRAKAGRLVAFLHALILPIPAARLGTPRQGPAGSRVKSHFFPGAFVARMPSGNIGIFKRRGRPRLPIKEQSISLEPEASAIVARHVRSTGAKEWRIEFEREMAWRLARKRV